MDKELTIACGMETSKGNFECDELIELLKQTHRIEWRGNRLWWDIADWVVFDLITTKTLYRGDSLIEALKILTKEE